jgi:hypothetical protein
VNEERKKLVPWKDFFVAEKVVCDRFLDEMLIDILICVTREMSFRFEFELFRNYFI